jgi:hypothetical protein
MKIFHVLKTEDKAFFQRKRMKPKEGKSKGRD